MESLSEKGIESFTVQKVQKNCRKQLSKGRNVKHNVREIVPSIRLRGDKENNKFKFRSMLFLCGTLGSLDRQKMHAFHWKHLTANTDCVISMPLRQNPENCIFLRKLVLVSCKHDLSVAKPNISSISIYLVFLHFIFYFP